jgi:hypothetical protein
MRVRCADLVDFSAVVNIEEGTTIGALKQILESNFKFEANPCAVFTLDREWQDADVIQQNADDPRLFVFFNTRSYREKSYPSVDDAFAFPTTRFGKRRPHRDLPVDTFAPQRAFGFADENIRLIQHMPPGDSDSSDDEGEPERRRNPFIRPEQLLRQRLFMEFRAQEIPALYARVDPHFEETEQPPPEAPENGNIDVVVDGVRVEVSIEDDRAVRRIREAVGADYQYILQVYRACDGNEEQTRALLESMR